MGRKAYRWSLTDPERATCYSSPVEGLVDESGATALDAMLRTWVGRAEYLFERIERLGDAKSNDPTECRPPAADPIGTPQLVRWMRVVSSSASSEAWARYLDGQALTEARVQEVLHSPPTALQDPSPDWIALLREVLCLGMVDCVNSVPADADSGGSSNPIHCRGEVPAPEPFEDLWSPFVAVFRRRLRLKADTKASLLTPKARNELACALTRQLCRLGLSVAYKRFCAYRAKRLGPLASFASQSGDRIYRAYVRDEFRTQLFSLFNRYPVLARQLATRTLFWCQVQTEMLDRLAADLPALADVFFNGSDPGPVTGIVTGAADFHSGGRSTAVLAFESGARLVYKPRPLDLDAAFNQFLLALMREGTPVDFRVAKVLPEGPYGWMEYVEQSPCRDQAGAERYYERLGGLLAVLYLLHATDIHFRNLVAGDGFPVGVDYECLLSPGAQLLSDYVPVNECGGHASLHSVCDIGILPSRSARREDGFDPSVLGAYDAQAANWHRPTCRHVNTDAMSVAMVQHAYEPENSVLYLQDMPAYPTEYLESIIRGFSSTYRFLIRCRDRGGAIQLLTPFRELVVRVLIRNTRLYDELIERCSTASWQMSGIDFGMGIEYLARAYAEREPVPGGWQLLEAERLAVYEGDIPVFHLLASGRVIEADGDKRVFDVVRRTAYDEVVKRLENLGECDLARQIQLICESLMYP
jgi:type 2 lantibiotic biosynthesis protein LanM